MYQVQVSWCWWKGAEGPLGGKAGPAPCWTQLVPDVSNSHTGPSSQNGGTSGEFIKKKKKKKKVQLHEHQGQRRREEVHEVLEQRLP